MECQSLSCKFAGVDREPGRAPWPSMHEVHLMTENSAVAAWRGRVTCPCGSAQVKSGRSSHCIKFQAACSTDRWPQLAGKGLRRGCGAAGAGAEPLGEFQAHLTTYSGSMELCRSPIGWSAMAATSQRTSSNRGGRPSWWQSDSAWWRRTQSVGSRLWGLLRHHYPTTQAQDAIERQRRIFRRVGMQVPGAMLHGIASRHDTPARTGCDFRTCLCWNSTQLGVTMTTTGRARPLT